MRDRRGGPTAREPAGVIDEIDERGLSGRIFDPEAEDGRIAFVVRCWRRGVGYGQTDLPSPEISEQLASRQNEGYFVAWDSIDFLEPTAARAEDDHATSGFWQEKLPRKSSVSSAG